jgi:hypothetical protein
MDPELQIEIDRLRRENTLIQVEIKQSNRQAKATKNWTATIYDHHGLIVRNSKGDFLIKDFERCSESQNWIDLRLAEGDSDNYGELKHNHSMMNEKIDRDDSLARIYKKKKGPVYHTVKASSKNLGFDWKMHESRCEFSRG